MNKSYPFWKLEGAGNDFIFFDGFTEAGKQVVDELSEAAIQKICDRHFGIGADGVIILTEGNTAPFWMRYWNSDGSVAGMCGNGLRCTLHFAKQRGYLAEEAALIELPTHESTVSVTALGDDLYRVAMPLATFDRPHIPMLGTGDAPEVVEVDGMHWEGFGVNVGNPHFIIPVDDSNESLAVRIGSQIEVDPLFPQKTNVEFAEIISRRKVKLWVWERGCGITLACGSGATATAAALVKAGKLDADVPLTLQLPGGVLTLEVSSATGAISLTGPAKTVFEGTYSF